MQALRKRPQAAPRREQPHRLKAPGRPQLLLGSRGGRCVGEDVRGRLETVVEACGGGMRKVAIVGLL